MIPKGKKYNLHYNDVRGDFLWPPHGTTPATVEQNKSKRFAFGNKENAHTKKNHGNRGVFDRVNH